MRVPRTPLKVWFWISSSMMHCYIPDRASPVCNLISCLLNAEDNQMMCKQFPLFLLRLSLSLHDVSSEQHGISEWLITECSNVLSGFTWGQLGYGYDSSQQLLIKFVLSGQQDNVEIRIPSVHTKAGDEPFCLSFKKWWLWNPHTVDIVEKHLPSGRKLMED